MASSQYIRLTTSERVGASANSSAASMQFNFGNNMDLQNITSFEVISCSFTNQWYNVCSQRNNLTIYFVDSVVGNTSASIAEGFYTTNSIITALQTAINAVITPRTCTITQSAINQRLTFTLSSGTANWYSIGLGSNVGFSWGSASGIAIECDSVPSLNGETVLHLHSPELALDRVCIPTLDGSMSCVNGFCSMHINVPFGARQIYEPTTYDLIRFPSPKSLTSISLNLRGDDGVLLNSRPNHELVLVLKVYRA